MEQFEPSVEWFDTGSDIAGLEEPVNSVTA